MKEGLDTGWEVFFFFFLKQYRLSREGKTDMQQITKLKKVHLFQWNPGFKLVLCTRICSLLLPAGVRYFSSPPAAFFPVCLLQKEFYFFFVLHFCVLAPTLCCSQPPGGSVCDRVINGAVQLLHPGDHIFGRAVCQDRTRTQQAFTPVIDAKLTH